MKQEPKNINSDSHQAIVDKTNFTSFCQKNCRVCSSPYRDYIHSLILEGLQYRVIVDKLKKEYSFDISIASLSRHRSNYRRALSSAIVSVEFEKFHKTAVEKSEHSRQVLFLVEKSFSSILYQLDNGTLTLSIDDFDKLVKLYYQIVNRPDGGSDNSDIIALFQRASEKSGFSLDQGVLFSRRNPPGNPPT